MFSSSRFPSVGAAVGCAAALLLALAPTATADPPDPHMPDITKNFCPGGHWGAGGAGLGGAMGVCDGAKYPDGSYWHQWVDNGFVGIGVTYHYDCVGDSGNNVFPAPPPPGGCDGAIPGAPGDAPPAENPPPPPGENPPPPPAENPPAPAPQ